MPSPQEACTLRSTSMGTTTREVSCPASNAMARSTCGSPNTLAKTNASAAATTPTSMPRINRLRAVMAAAPALVAGEAEQVPAVVGELVHPLAGRERRGALLGADEVDRHDGQQQAEHGPRQQLPDRDRHRYRRGLGGG